jgi:hypothetical protein
MVSTRPEKIKKTLKSIGSTLKQHYIIVLVILFFLASHYILVKDYTALPSPIYGGDYYFQLGATNHVKYGGNPLDSSNINGSLPAYFVTYSFLSGNIAKVFNISALSAEIILSYITIITSIILIYLLINKLFKNKYIAAICAIIYHIPLVIVFKYTNFAQQLVAIALILAIYIFLEKESYKNAIVLGIILGIAGLTHSVMFISSCLLLAIVFIYNFIIKNRQHIRDRQYKKIFQSMPKYAIVIIIGVAIAMLWWFKPIFYYHGATAAHYTEIQQASLDKISQQIIETKNIFTQTFVNFTSPVGIIYSIITLAGIFLFFITKKSEEKRFVGLIFFSALIINLHFLITYNLFGFHLIPSYMISLLVYPASLLMFAFGLHVASSQIKNRMSANIVLAFLILLLIVLSISSTIMTDKSQWSTAAKAGLPAQLSGLEKYLVQNTSVYDNILSTNELSYSVNAISGRKVMISRRAQNDPFTELDRREVDAAIILYGNDTIKRAELLKKYDIKYVYWNYYWINSEFQTDDSGKITGWFDPLLTIEEFGYYRDFDKYDIKYFEQNTWVDPTLKGDDIKTFDVAIVAPQNYHNFTNPWNPDLNKYLKEVWSYEQSGQKIAVLYEVTT